MVCVVICVSFPLRKVRESVPSDGGTRNHASDGNHCKTSVSRKREKMELGLGDTVGIRTHWFAKKTK